MRIRFSEALPHGLGKLGLPCLLRFRIRQALQNSPGFKKQNDPLQFRRIQPKAVAQAFVHHHIRNLAIPAARHLLAALGAFAVELFRCIGMRSVKARWCSRPDAASGFRSLVEGFQFLHRYAGDKRASACGAHLRFPFALVVFRKSLAFAAGALVDYAWV